MASVIEPKIEKGSKPESKQDTTSTTPLTQGFANKLALFLNGDESYKEWEQFPQLVEHIKYHHTKITYKKHISKVGHA